MAAEMQNGHQLNKLKGLILKDQPKIQTLSHASIVIQFYIL